MTSTPDMIVSKNRLEGSLGDTRLDEILDACLRHLVTGALKVVDDKGGRGVMVLRAGAVDQARFGDAVGDAAVDSMRKLGNGSYELSQRLPDLSGHLGGAAALEGQVHDVPLIPIMQHCERHALSCTIIVIGGFDRGEIVYRAGELVRVTLNGQKDDDAIVAMLGWREARFRVVAPPLPSDISGWPKLGREETQPFRLDAALLPRKSDVAAEDETRARQRHERRMASGTAEIPSLAPAIRQSPPPVPADAAPRALEPPAAPGRGVFDAVLLTFVALLAFSLIALVVTR